MKNENWHIQLNRFAGRWNTEGRVIADGRLISGTDTYEWLDGAWFLVHKANVRIGETRNETLEVIGWNPEQQHYGMHYFDSEGSSGFMNAVCDGDDWKYSGDGLRFSGSFKKNGDEFSGLWEQLSDDEWQPLMEICLTRKE